MMQNNTKKKIVPMLITAIIVLYMGILVVLMLSVLGKLTLLSGFNITVPFLLIYIVAGLAVIVGIIRALRQRIREIDSGEEEEASQY